MHVMTYATNFYAATAYANFILIYATNTHMLPLCMCWQYVYATTMYVLLPTIMLYSEARVQGTSA